MDTTNHADTNIVTKRVGIRRQLQRLSPHITDDVITALTVSDLHTLFHLYNLVFFDAQLLDGFPGHVRFSLSSRLTKSAGKTLFSREPRNRSAQSVIAEIRMATDLFGLYDELPDEKKVCGLPTSCALEAFQLVFEHEICHLREFLLYDSSNCNANRFKAMARDLFGHTKSTHNLPTRQRVASEKHGLHIGTMVSFTYQGETLQGVITNVTKRATVMVPDPTGSYVDAQGIKYTKFYVPVPALEPILRQQGRRRR